MDYWTSQHGKDCRCGCNENYWMKLQENPKKLVTILAGFLGAGKTTTVNNMLSQNRNLRTDVIVREFGAISVDDKLINNENGRVHHFNGASLHVDQQTMLTNFIENLHGNSSSNPFDYLIIEASGADNAEAIAQIFYLPRSRGHYTLGSFICIVDGEYGSLNLHEFRVAREQVALADYLVINKCDCASEEEINKLEKELRIINPFAEIVKTSFGQIDAERLSVTESYEQLRAIDFNNRSEETVEEFKSVSIRIKKPLDRQKVDKWIAEVYEQWGKKMLRGKGYFNIAGSDYRFDFQSVRKNFHAKTESKWESEEARESVVVFIGAELPEREELESGLKACIAEDAPVKIEFRKER